MNLIKDSSNQNKKSKNRFIEIRKVEAKPVAEKRVKKEVEEEEDYAWTCDYCGEEFESKSECAKHEKECSENPKNIKKESKNSKNKYCSECGSKYNKNTKFCSECGNKLDNEEEDEPENEVVVAKKTGGHGLLKMVLVIIVILLILFFTAPVFPKYDSYSYQETVNRDDCDNTKGCVCKQHGGFLWLTCKQCSCTRQGTSTSYRTMAQMVFG